jgi:hypothetical protein
MTWLVLHDGHYVTVDAQDYIQSQPVSYEQVADIIDEIRRQGVPVRAYIDVTGLRISRVNIFGVIRIIWELHEKTYGENLLCSFDLVGASPRVYACWSHIKKNLPEFITGMHSADPVP